MQKSKNTPDGGFWSTREAALFISFKLGRRAKPLSERTIRGWAQSGHIPANKSNSPFGPWYYEPRALEKWLNGGYFGAEFYVAYLPNKVVWQLRKMLRDLCLPENQEGNNFIEGWQENLCLLVRKVLGEERYRPIRQSVRNLCLKFRENAALSCLESIPGLYSDRVSLSTKNQGGQFPWF